MKSDPKIIQHLNKVLKNELTAVNQYFLHARMCKNWGFEELNEKDYKISIKSMKNADAIIERVLLLEGLPNLQDLGKLFIGEDVPEMLNGDYHIATNTHTGLIKAISLCESTNDYVSRELLEDILESNEEHIDWIETQNDLIVKVGLKNYLQSMMND